MKRSEIYLKAAENCHVSESVFYTDSVFDAVRTVSRKYEFETLRKCPELNDNETDKYEKVEGYYSRTEDRDFILLFASELAKDTNN